MNEGKTRLRVVFFSSASQVSECVTAWWRNSERAPSLSFIGLLAIDTKRIRSSFSHTNFRSSHNWVMRLTPPVCERIHIKDLLLFFAKVKVCQLWIFFIGNFCCSLGRRSRRFFHWFQINSISWISRKKPIVRNRKYFKMTKVGQHEISLSSLTKWTNV